MSRKLEPLRFTIHKLLTHPFFQIGVLIVLLFILYCITLNTVPFHPDEATYLYKSNDVKLLLTNPLLLAYHQGDAIDLKNHYRLMDPPLNSLIIGLTRTIARVPANLSDWDWTLSWEANQLAGSMPSDEALQVSRMAFLIFFPFTFFFLYQTTRSLINHRAGLLAVLFFGLNPLILIHTRRAMAEGILLFTVCFFLMLILDKKKHPFGVPILLALCLNSKQTALFFIPMYILYYVIINHRQKKIQWIKTAGYFTLIPLVITYMLNPVSWLDPIHTIQAAIQERAELTRTTTAFLQENYPERIPESKLVRFVMVNYHTFFEPVALDDVGNYRTEQQKAFDAYTDIPLQHQNRSFLLSSLQLIGILSAFLLQALAWWKAKSKLPEDFPQWMLFYVGFGGAMLGLSMLGGLYQRYVIILIPFICILSAWIINQTIVLFRKIKPA
jgi:4-amino-4-deoxy-L-arabinose transferase-like glycosyltransferase